MTDKSELMELPNRMREVVRKIQEQIPEWADGAEVEPYFRKGKILFRAYPVKKKRNPSKFPYYQKSLRYWKPRDIEIEIEDEYLDRMVARYLTNVIVFKSSKEDELPVAPYYRTYLYGDYIHINPEIINFNDDYDLGKYIRELPTLCRLTDDEEEEDLLYKIGRKLMGEENDKKN